jgi:hypothetical protein
MIELDAVELVLEGLYGVAVGLHLVVATTRILHDLVNHELRVPPDVKAFDACLNGDSEAARPQRRALYSTMLFDVGKCRRTAYLMCSLRGEMKSRPVPAPVFITDPSK